MNNTSKGWIVFIAAMGMMLTLNSVEIANLSTWHEVASPTFVGKMFAHVGTVIAAFIGGKLIPTNRGE